MIPRFESEGMKVALGKYEGNVFILPSGSDDIVSDSVVPRQLQTTEDMDARLKRLIELKKEWK
ncbi:MAG: hypothetical protein NUV61_00385 [Candidatus Azambacteria bacterium]|nr:hypothetical protein [Candidatus Azambacteria bacterium]